MRAAVVFVLLLTAGLLLYCRSEQTATREEAKENEVAAAFLRARQEAGREPLARIRYRKQLEQIVCSASTLDKVPTFPWGTPALAGVPNYDRPSALYKTSNPADINDEMRRLAKHAAVRRFSVAVWSAKHEAELPEYWVGIGVYGSAAGEFFDNHFTDDVFRRNDWKKVVVQACRGK